MHMALELQLIKLLRKKTFMSFVNFKLTTYESFPTIFPNKFSFNFPVIPMFYVIQCSMFHFFL